MLAVLLSKPAYRTLRLDVLREFLARFRGVSEEALAGGREAGRASTSAAAYSFASGMARSRGGARKVRARDAFHAFTAFSSAVEPLLESYLRVSEFDPTSKRGDLCAGWLFFVECWLIE